MPDAVSNSSSLIANIGHFDNEIDMAGLAKWKGIEKINIKPQYDEWVFPDGHKTSTHVEVAAWDRAGRLVAFRRIAIR